MSPRPPILAPRLRARIAERRAWDLCAIDPELARAALRTGDVSAYVEPGERERGEVIADVRAAQASCEAMQARARGLDRAEYLRRLAEDEARAAEMRRVASAAVRADAAEARIAEALRALAGLRTLLAGEKVTRAAVSAAVDEVERAMMGEAAER